MKERIIELVKRSKVYPLLKSMLYQTKKKDYKSGFLTPNETNIYIGHLLLSSKPILISRLGSSELGILQSYVRNKKYKNTQRKIIKQNAGFFPTDDKSLDKFCTLYEDIIPSIDLAGISFIPFENYMLNIYSPNAKLTKLRNLEPYFYENPWSQYLENKKVLVIHPFDISISSQFENRKNIFENQKILPNFKLITYRPPQTLGGGNGEFNSWFDALEKIQSDIAKLDFDIAIIGAGVYGLPIASYIKGIGKSAIHLGGSTQILFGVYGRRWEIHPDFKEMINKHWVRPLEDEKPLNAKKVENSCYW